MHSTELTQYIDYLLDLYDVKGFYYLDELHQDRLVALAIKDCGYDTDITLDHEANSIITRLLTKYDRDDEIQLTQIALRSAKEHFAHDIDELIDEVKNERFHDQMHEMGATKIIDPVNGEIRWI